jgi:tRNA(Arg) A34 adenosine deaminase TadA
MTDEEYMEEAIQVALNTDGPKKFGAILVYGGEIISRACNIIASGDPTHHAEILAISKAAQIFRDITKFQECTLYITCEPCVMCSGAIFRARIPRVIYGMYRYRTPFNFFDSEKLHTNIEDLAGYKPKIVIESGVLADRCIKLLMPTLEEYERDTRR